MNRGKKIVRNVVIIIILFLLSTNILGFYLNPLRAHRNSERSLHYGPSEIVHIRDFDESKYILGKYDKWFSCSPVNRHLFFFWKAGGGSYGHQINKTEAVNYAWEKASQRLYRIYGVINDDRITKIEIILNNGNTLMETEFHDDMFLMVWESPDDKDMDWDFTGIKAYDTDNNVMFEEIY